MRDRRQATLGIAVMVAALAASLAGCGGKHAGTHGAGDGPPVAITAIRALPAGEADLVLPARVAAGEEVVVTARHAGRVTALPHREGDRFRAGEPLVAFDAPEAREALAAARAALDAGLVRGEQARRQEARMESLFASRVASQRERELAQAERRDAEAALASAQAGFAEVSTALAIPAPFDGVVVRRMLDPGATVGPGQPVLAIRSRAPAEVVAAVPESELGRLARARFAFRSGDGPWRDAVLARVDGMTDYATRTRVARFRPARGGEPLEPGAFARVRIAGAAPRAGAAAAADGPLSVPARSLVRRGALTGVYVVRDGRAYLRWLRIGAADGERVEVLSGLSPDELIAADPAGLADGRAVEVAR
jgi:RND family efflux transporter MFP subunit